jgi:hypothetical protein
MSVLFFSKNKLLSQIAFAIALLFYSNNSFFTCIKIVNEGPLKSYFYFLPEGGNCQSKLSNGILTHYKNPDIVSSSNKANNFDVLIEGKNNPGYNIEFSFHRDNDDLTGEQILFSAYGNGEDPVIQSGIRQGEFFYRIGYKNINSINMEDLNDAELLEPHTVVITYHDGKRGKSQVILNIDGVEVISNNVNPVKIESIKKIQIGKIILANQIILV